jgi:guanylate kinase
VIKENGLLVVLSSPSGGGKTTVIKKVIHLNPDYLYSISMTTRSMRTGEENGRDYWFVSEEEFAESIKAGNFVEYEKVHGCYYGTPITKISEWVDQQKIVFLDLDVYGALRLKEKFENRALLIFLKPPDEKSLVNRLVNRSTETQQQIEKRLTRMPEEIKMAEEFDSIVINEDLDDTIKQVKLIVEKKRSTL